jgi:uroporphyrin-III C-methyltransferase / precorrin-2 dehydrogenase / sirohydrochlorin ferrochelatase
MHVVPPRETRASRMRPLAVLPVFYDLAAKSVVLAGGGDGLIWKCELIAATGARITLFWPDEVPDELAHLIAAPQAGSITHVARAWQPEDLAGCALAVGGLEGEEAEAFAAAARAAGVPVNVIDTPQLCSFSFGTVVNRSPIVLGISTAGVAPVLGQAIRARIEALLPQALSEWGAAAQRLRGAIKARLPMGHARRALWRRFADLALAARNAPSQADLDAILRETPSQAGSVALVGAGPGDPELVTLKALRALQSADVVLYDRLVAPEILELARREAARMLVGKACGGAQCRQDDINALMVKLALSGKRVVRLKGGDPMIFGRAAEEIEICRANGIAVEVIPGITAALGAAAELQLPLTDRRHAQRLQFVTGHAKSGRAPQHDWASLARDDVTTVFYMGARTFAQMLPQMLSAGLPPDMPALAISGATTPHSRRITAPVAQLPAVLPQLPAAVPCLILVGRCAAALDETQAMAEALRA